VWKVGELAAASGVAARTIHFYDEIGLLSPSGRTRSGERRYTEVDARRLHRIVVLRSEGHPVKQLRDLLAEEPGEAAGASGDAVVAALVAMRER
jgi:MerR family transcriptional regulator, thiopeptide resistance regulator